MNAETIAKALGGRRAGRGFAARCPAHNDRNPSLSISDGDGGRVLVHCHAGCGQRQVIAALKARGLWDKVCVPRDPGAQRWRRENDVRRESHRIEAAMNIWRSCRSAERSPVAAYLRSRGITIPLPPSIRYHPALIHGPTGLRLPCMVAAVQQADGKTSAVHRTFLQATGAGKANVSQPKMMLGPCRSGAVRLSVAGPRLAVGEGLETCLAVRQSCPDLPVWAALSAPGLARIAVPSHVQELIVLADADVAGEEAARALLVRHDNNARTVRISRPPPPHNDFNDVLLGQAQEAAHG